MISTDPDTDTEVPSGSEVRLVVSSAVTVPDLSGKSMEDAAEALRDAGLNPVTGDAVSDTDEDACSDASSTRPAPARRHRQRRAPGVQRASSQNALEELAEAASQRHPIS